MAKRLTIVLGMHRSGTSVISRALKIFGIEHGNRLIGPHPDNPKGFWEDVDLKNLNEDLLQCLNWSWQKIGLCEQADQIKELFFYKARAENLLNEKLRFTQHFTFKDPRTSLLLPFWNELLSKIPLDVDYIYCVRNPRSVADSLHTRNKIESSQAYCLWLHYNTNILRQLKNRKCLLIDYDRFVDNFSIVTQELTHFLKLPIIEVERCDYVDNYLDSNFRHSQYDLDFSPTGLELVDRAHLLYQQLLERSSGLNQLVSEEFQDFHTISTKILYSYAIKHDVDYFPIHELREVASTPVLDQSDVNFGEIEKFLFNEEWYRARYPDMRSPEIDVFQHYLQHGKWELRDPNPLFDSAWYANKYFGGKNGTDLLEHFVTHGQEAGNDPSPLFDTTWYLEQYPEAKDSNLNVLVYFLTEGTRLQHQPCRMFFVKWYLSCAPEIYKHNINSVVHYLIKGFCEGLDPNPFFCSNWYLEKNSDVRHGGANPFVHFMTCGALEGRDPSPYFSIGGYWSRYPEVRERSENALDHYVKNALNGKYIPHPFFSNHDYMSNARFCENKDLSPFAMCVNRVRLKSKYLEDLDLSITDYYCEGYNLETEERTKSEVNTYQFSDGGAPLVSIIMATKNRKNFLGKSIQSIVNQSYSNWELLVVDDGSEDSSFEYLKSCYKDSRIKLFRIESAGVSVARNYALCRAKGEWIAYLDSDNRWEACFLENCLKYAMFKGYDLVYSGVEVLFDGGKSYAFNEFSYSNLERRNFIDLNSVVHRRKYFDELGGFDCNLRRNVDWDLVLRYASVNPRISLVPFLGVFYDGLPRADRISCKEFTSWELVLKDKYLKNSTCGSIATSGRLAVIIPILYEDLDVERVVKEVFNSSCNFNFDIILVDPQSSTEVTRKLLFLAECNSTIHYLGNPLVFTFALACNHAARCVNSDYLLFLDQRVLVTRNCIQNLFDELQNSEEVAAIQARIICKFSGKEPPYIDYSVLVSQVTDTRLYFSPFCLMVNTESFAKIGSFSVILANEYEFLDLLLRVNSQNIGVCDNSIAYLIVNSESKLSVGFYESSKEVFLSLWPRLSEKISIGLKDRESIDEGQDYSKALVRLKNNKQLNIKIAAPGDHTRELWGDYHFARALVESFAKYGYTAQIVYGDSIEQFLDNDCSINLVLRGLKQFVPVTNSLNMLWIISHPGLIEARELEDFDYIFCASEFFMNQFSAVIKEKSSFLMQCANTQVCYPAAKDTQFYHEVLFVGNSRNKFRPIVEQAILAEVDLSVYGSLWEQFIPERYIHGVYLENSLLGQYYSNADVVLNDHWEDMREHGFVSNRVFDVLACAAPLISDEIVLPDEIEGFVDVIPSYEREVGNIQQKFRDVFSETKRKREDRIDIARLIAEEHNCDKRVQKIIEQIEKFI